MSSSDNKEHGRYIVAETVTNLPRIPLNLGSRSIWYLLIYSNNSSVPRTFAIRTSCLNTNRQCKSVPDSICRFLIKSSQKHQILSTWLFKTYYPNTCETAELLTNKVQDSNLLQCWYLVIVIVTVKEWLFLEDHTCKHTAETPQV